jgi:hypothetical protein
MKSTHQEPIMYLVALAVLLFHCLSTVAIAVGAAFTSLRSRLRS